jgi:hypothetical protein
MYKLLWWTENETTGQTGWNIVLSDKRTDRMKHCLVRQMDRQDETLSCQTNGQTGWNIVLSDKRTGRMKHCLVRQDETLSSLEYHKAKSKQMIKVLRLATWVTYTADEENEVWLWSFKLYKFLESFVPMSHTFFFTAAV